MHLRPGHHEDGSGLAHSLWDLLAWATEAHRLGAELEAAAVNGRHAFLETARGFYIEEFLVLGGD